MRRLSLTLAVVAAIFIVTACDSGGTEEEITPPPTFTPRAVADNPLSSPDAHLDASTSLPGVYIPPHPGRDGIEGSDDDVDHETGVIPICGTAQIAGSNFSDPLCYHSNPPTSGPHANSPAPFRVLDSPALKENVVHSMEHGGVVVWYNTQNQAAIDQLAQVVNDELRRGSLVLMSRYTEMEPDTIALTAWTRLDKFSTAEMNRQRVTDFIQKHQRRFNPEGF